MPRDDVSAPGSGRTMLSVLLAVIFLAVIGGSAGVIAGMREIRANRLAVATAPQPTATPSRGGSPTPYRQSCPEPTVQGVAAKGGDSALQVRRYLETQLSEVWICAGADGQIWYQGHRKGSTDPRYPGDDLVEGENGLLLPAKSVPENRFEAINHGTRYTVSPDQLTITNPDGSQEIQRAVDTFP